ncbi:MAG: helix-turn-helix transcriptional regulator [Nocardioidaceae bacterium]
MLALLQDAGGALTADDIAGRLRLHPNTARFHLDALEGAGLASRSIAAARGRGRPRAVFTAAGNTGMPGPRSYRLLAQVLASYIAQTADDPAAAARNAGETWGRLLVRGEPRPPRAAEQAVDHVTARLRTVGFDAHQSDSATDTDDEMQVEITHCPFLEVAEAEREVVCSVHLGLMTGALAEIGAPVTTGTLEPLVEPSLCVAHMRRTKPRRRSDPSGEGVRFTKV